ncbi:hypothetical protein MMAN_35920 [Mycobacterium mantenii]|uniref:Uncharacterized protein n=1 Tax=Mycobacterium mantenii TaxID=560555 RepID=A0ABM7JV58_MYCNT|nr:hypothetical protein MMAN_35920 [Mycobacterium mantenii]
MAPGSLPGTTPDVLQGPRCSIGCPGPGVPPGGGTPGSTVGGLIANAGGLVHVAAAGSNANAAATQADAGRIID